MITAVTAVPLALAVGLAVDFSSGVNTRSSMQNALDAATLSLSTLPPGLTDEERLAKLQAFYAGNGGAGMATLVSFNIGNTGAVDAQTSASYKNPTNFMHLAKVFGVGVIDADPSGEDASGADARGDDASVGASGVNIEVGAAIHKEPNLDQATFELSKATTGWWNKTVTLYGKKYGAASEQKLMQIKYVSNRFHDPRGYGKMTVSTISTAANGTETLTTVQERNCTTKTIGNTYTPSTDPIRYSDGTGSNKKSWQIDCTQNGSGKAVIDVSQMQNLYLQMDIPKKDTNNPDNPSTKTVLKTTDPTKANHLFIDGVQAVNGTSVDIFTVVPCGQTSEQAWEDGGSPSPYTAAGTDFTYKVTGRCGYTQRPGEVTLTQ